MKDAFARVSSVNIVENSRWAKRVEWIGHLTGNIPRDEQLAATTLPNEIHLPRLSLAQFYGDRVLTLHEYSHILLQWDRGMTVLNYLGDHTRYEDEARESAVRMLDAYQNLLGN